jgi:hypothetical protein
VQKTARFSLVARLNVIGFFGPGWATRRNAIGFGLETRSKSLLKGVRSDLEAGHKSLQHEYKCSFDNGMGPKTLNFPKTMTINLRDSD